MKTFEGKLVAEKVRVGIDILAKPLSGGKTAICLFNKRKGNKKVSVDLQKIVDDEYVKMNHKNEYTLTEQWTGEIVKMDRKFTTKLNSYECKVYIV